VRGRTVRFHSLRHTIATIISTGGVQPRVTQAAMRHSTMDLTVTVYTDPSLLDVEGALAVLPDLPLRPKAIHSGFNAAGALAAEL